MNNIIGDARRAAGLTQTQLAEKAGIKIGTIRKLESGERSIMKAQLDTILPLARALNVTVEELAGE
jgi:transcriptional regulator with XRE-family HTH domain